MALLKLRRLRFLNGFAALAAGVMLLAAAAPSPTYAAGDLTVAEQQQASKLAAQIVQLIQGMPTTSTQADYQSVIAGASAGVSCSVAKVALAAVAATPGVPPAAAAAAKAIAAGCTGATVSAVSPPPPSGPDFSPGGGGPNYQ